MISREEILLKMIHNVNYKIETLIVELQQNNLSGDDVCAKLRNIQSIHLNYADQKNLDISLQEYEFDLGGNE